RSARLLLLRTTVPPAPAAVLLLPAPGFADAPAAAPLAPAELPTAWAWRPEPKYSGLAHSGRRPGRPGSPLPARSRRPLPHTKNTIPAPVADRTRWNSRPRNAPQVRFPRNPSASPPYSPAPGTEQPHPSAHLSFQRCREHRPDGQA